ncbi:hypothetical protein GQR58_022888 [Nymphon striatum]|nr:hypothetical protein GQR58_022888 [Nymphon striatum]
MANEERRLLAPTDKSNKMLPWMVTLLIISEIIGGGSLVLPHVIQATERLEEEDKRNNQFREESLPTLYQNSDNYALFSQTEVLLGIIGSLSIVIPLTMIIWIIVFDPGQIITHGDNISVISWKSISFAYGIEVYIFAAIPIYPSIQIDMINPKKFGRSLIYASIVHVFTQALLSMNPVNQSIEGLLGISSDFNWKRILSRTSFLAFLIFIAVTFTQFEYIMNILGASALVMLAFVCPLSFYMKLTSMKAPETLQLPNRKVSRLEKFFMLVIIIVTSIGGAVSIYNAFNEISKVSKFEIPSLARYNFSKLRFVSEVLCSDAVCSTVSHEIESDTSLLLPSYPEQNGKEMSVWKVSLLIFGQMIGGGCLILPHVIQITGALGLSFIILMGGMTYYCGKKLADCWIIITQRWPEYDKHIRDPYPVLADVCYGPVVREIVRINMHLTLSGNIIVLLLIGSETAASILESGNLSRCTWILIIYCVLILPSWLGTPKDFWQLGFFSTTSIVFPVITIVWIVMYRPDYVIENEKAIFVPLSFHNITFAYGIMVFLYASVATYPSLQMDMKKKDMFGKALLFGTLGHWLGDLNPVVIRHLTLVVKDYWKLV